MNTPRKFILSLMLFCSVGLCVRVLAGILAILYRDGVRLRDIHSQVMPNLLSGSHQLIPLLIICL